jgi:peptide/nickel transport system permease protein
MYLLIGVSLGALAGFYGGVTDAAIMRATDVFMSFPPLILIVTLVALLGPSLFNVMIAIGFLGWPASCRLVRGQFLSLREREFVEAARAIGVRDARLIFRHVLPSAITPVVVSASFGLAEAILLEAGLSFLGLGVQPPTASWGGMLNAAQSMTTLRDYPWMWLPPGMLIFLTVVSINFVGDGLRDALDPRTTR